MQEKYDRNKVDRSFTKFKEYANDVLNSEYSTFDSNFEIFIDHCENDEIMSIICNQLKYDNTILEEWWSENNLNGFLSQLGSRKLKLPINESKRISLFYQICLKVNKQEIDLLSFCINFTNCNPDGAIVYFNKNIVMPTIRSIKYKLDEITSEDAEKRGDNRYIPINVFYVYHNLSTNVNGNIDIGGDSAIGEGAKIEKKSLFLDSPININSDVNTGGDSAIVGNAKIIKTIKEKKKPSLFDIMVGIVTLVAGLIAIYKFYTGN